jgi:uncharacterized protein
MVDPIVLFERRMGRSPDHLDALLTYDTSHSTAALRSEAWNRLRDLANHGDHAALCLCSRILKNGVLVPRGPKEAFAYAARAASVGYGPGYFELGECLEQGIGTAADKAAAREEYERAATAGYSLAKVRLAAGYRKGEWGVIDGPRARSLLQDAAEDQDAFAALELAEWLEQGVMGAADPGQALHWYEIASELGNPFATYRLVNVYRRGELGKAIDTRHADQLQSRLDHQ